jgi:hypothetical protein
LMPAGGWVSVFVLLVLEWFVSSCLVA